MTLRRLRRVFVNIPMTEDEEIVVRYSVNKGKPFGSDGWSGTMIDKYGLKATIRKRGRQIKGT